MLRKNILDIILTHILLTVFIFLFSISASAQLSQPDSTKFSNQILKIEQQLMNDIPTGNTENWNKYLHTSFFMINEDGTMLNKAAFLKTFAPLPKGYSGFINVIKPKIVFYPETAVVNYVSDEYENVFDSKLHTQYSSMNTYIKTDTSWQMVSSQVFEIPLPPPAVTVASNILKAYTGTYKLSEGIFCDITFSNNSLFYQKTGRDKVVMLPETDNIFFRAGDNRGRKLFVKDIDGNMLMKERRNGQDVVWKKIK